ncbi:MAG: hypothetical protein HKN27_05650 [Silicimonas sp.]|nr:hypothetical protein [Silicimonas sp.]
MSSFALPFVVMPSIAACMVAWFVTDWRLAGAIAAGSLSILFIPALTQVVSVAVYLLPLLFGAAIGAMVSGVACYRSHDTTTWSRMLYALVITVTMAILAFLFLSQGR